MFAYHSEFWAGQIGLPVRILAGIVVWLTVLIMRLPEPSSRPWGGMLLLLAGLLLLPMGFDWLVPVASCLHYRL